LFIENQLILFRQIAVFEKSKLMKKLFILFVSAIMMLTIVPSQAGDIKGLYKKEVAGTNTLSPDDVAAYEARINAIKAMDKASMTAAERKELRKEVRTIESELKLNSGGVYISVGVLILIIILLIVLL
jgi:hypothetical protein